jgi:hypothetical protein
VRTDGFGGAGGGERRVGDVEGGLGGMRQQAGLAVAGVDITLDADDGSDVGMPVGAGEFVGGIEDGDEARLVAVAALVVAARRTERSGDRADLLGLLVQGRLVVLDLDDQGDVGVAGDVEQFF